MKPLCLTVIAALLLVVALPAYAAPATGTLQAPSAYAWGENLGWVNLNPSNGGLIITDTAVRGYAWSRQFGWINFNPTASGQGVSNTDEGQLSGFAWVAAKGWLDMSGVRINDQGRFEGIAGHADTEAGRLSFDCSTCAVVTDWRPASARQSHSGSGGNPPAENQTPSVPAIVPVETVPAQPGVTPLPPPVQPVNTVIPPRTPVGGVAGGEIADAEGLIQTHNGILTVYPDQSGILTQEFDDGTFARIDIVSGASAGQFSIRVTPAVIDFRGYEPSIRPIGNFFFDISALDEHGKEVQEFDTPLKITLPLVGGGAVLSDLGVYWLDEATGDWQRVEAAAFSDASESFYTKRLARFAILSAPGNPETIRRLPADLRAFLLFALPAFALLSALALYWGFRNPQFRMRTSRSTKKS